ncbi:MAG: AMP-binding protein [Clostridia bacterium]|nr:AMP-binding protein [Clostridia bacterium]
MYENVLEYLEAAAQKWPGRVGFADDTEEMTYAALLDAARRIGTGIAAKTEMRRPVAVIMTDRSVRCVAGMLGAVYAGCPYAPLDAAMPTERLRVILEQLQPGAILCDDATREGVNKAEWPCPVLTYEQTVQTAIDRDRLDWIRSRVSTWDVLSILFTSGSTGVPKGVAQSHRSYIAYTETNSERFGFTMDDVYANQSPFFYANSITDIYPPIKLGAKVYVMPTRCLSFPRLLIETLRDRRVSVLCMTPSSYVKAAASGAMTQGCLPDLKYIILSGEAAHWQTLAVWLNAAPNAKVWNFYGSTELLGVAVQRLERTYSDGELIPVGRTYAGVEVLIVDEDGNELPRGEKGEMLIANPWLFSGYYRDKVRTDAAFADDPLGRGYRTRYYCTGDIGCIGEDGMLTVHGRKDSQIKRAGYRMELGEVEAALRQIPGWDNGLALYDKESGKLCCFWTGPLTQKEILTALKKSLPRYALPDTYVHLEEMPYTATMKIDRVKLRQMI